MAQQLPSPGESYGTHVGKWSANDTELYTLYTLLEIAVGALNFGSFTGSTLSDNEKLKTLIQELETAIELQSENILINQDFSIWQENTTFTNPANDVYTADGYLVRKVDGGGTAPSVNVKKNTSVHEDAFAQSCELEVTNVGVADAGMYWGVRQDIEDFEKYKGKTVTLAIRIRASTSLVLAGRLSVYDGVGSDVINITSVGTSWVTYSITRILDSSATQIWTFFDIAKNNGTISTTGSVYIQWMRFVLGSVDTPLIPEKTADSLDDSQRHYQKTYAQGVFPGTATEIGAVWQEITAVASADHTITIDVKFPKVMKAAPTIVLYDLAGNSGRVTMAAGDDIVGTVSQISDSGFKIAATNGAAATSRKLAFHYTAISRV